MSPCSDPADSTLLLRYALEGSEAAFAEFVDRHLVLVYSAALRQLDGDAHRAQDVTQAVFTELARQARKLAHHAALTGWLYTTTHHLVRRQLRSDKRRADREREAHLMQELDRASETDWKELRPILDEAMQELREPDRLAVLLRYFEGRNLRAVGTALGVSEDAARMRVDRALDRLRTVLNRRGIQTTAAALAPTLGALAAEATPAGLAGQVVAGALATAGAASGSAGLLATLQTQIAIMKAPLLTASLATMLATVPLVLQHQQLAATRAELTRLHEVTRGLAELRFESDRLRQFAATAEELDRLRAQSGELQRLRKEKADLQTALNTPLQDDLVQAESARRVAQSALEQVTTRVAFAENREQTVNALKQLGLAARIYSNDHQDQLPRSFEEFAAVIKDSQSEGLPLERFEFYPQPRPIAETEPNLFLLREKEPRRNPDGAWERAYTLVDGSVQTLGSPTPDFTEPERKANGIASP